MALITTSVPNLVGGVSQQPATQRLPNQCEAQENAMPLVVGGLTKRPPTNYVNQLKNSTSSVNATDAFTHVVTRDVDEEFLVTLTGSGNTVLVHDLDGTQKIVHTDLGSSTYLTDSSPSANFKAVSIADVTFLVNTSVTCQLADTLSTFSRGLTAQPNEALIWIKASGQGIHFKVQSFLDGGSEVQIGEFDHDPAATDIDPDGSSETYAYPPDPPSTEAIAANLAADINLVSNYTSTSQGSVVFVSHSSTDFTLTVEDSLGQSAHRVIKDSVQNFSDLPSIAKNGMKILVKGDPESDVDDYHVVFETNGGADFGEGLWVETIGGGEKFTWNYDTLPHILIRQSDGTFMVKRADRTTPGSNVPAGADYTNFGFNPRETGALLTNPNPSFVDKKINDISFFKNRLVLLSGENAILSETAFYFNFFRTTVTQLLDTAVVDVGVGGTEINELKSAVPFSDRLILFSDRTQFALQGEAILSPLTASITQVTNFDVQTSMRPVASGSSLFFPFTRGSFSGVREFFKTNETDIQFDALESTAQVPKYISGTIKQMSASTHEDVLAVLAGTSNELYIYKYFNNGRERVQSAWSKFTFTGATILNLQFVGSALFLVVVRDSKTYLERMDLQTGLVDTGSKYVTTLDRRHKLTGQTGTTLTLPTNYEMNSSDAMQVVTTGGDTVGVSSVSGNTITLSKAVTNEDLFVGLSYTMKYEFTEPTLKKGTPKGGFEMVAAGRHQLRYMTVVFEDTAFFKVKVTPEIGGADGSTTEYPFSGRFYSAGGLLGSIPSQSGDFRFPVFARSDRVKIEIENDSAFPSNLQSVEFEASYVTRSQPRI